MGEFMPYIQSMHGGNFPPQNYYRNILHEYNQLNPNKTHREVYDYINNNIDVHMNNMHIPWKSSSFANVWSKITKKF